MSKSILDDIENAIYQFIATYRENNQSDPKLVIKFSNDGYNECRGNKLASCFFSHPHGYAEAMFIGYPYEVIDGQVETFKIELVGL